MSLNSHIVLAATLTSLTISANALTIIFQDNFTTTGQDYSGGGPVYQSSLVGTAPTVGSGTWVGAQGGADTGGWGQTGSGFATPTTSNFLAFTPNAGLTYTVTMTIDTTPLGGADPGGTSSWFTAGFTSSLHNWTGADASTIDVANLVRWYSNTVTTLNYTVSGADLVAGGVQYVGWVTDRAGTVNLSNAQQIKISNFSLTAVPEPSATLLGGLGMLALLRRRR